MNTLDYGLVIAYLIGMIVMGLFFKKNKASGDYFLGGRQFGWFSLCMSAMATQLSVISFVSAPAFVGLRQGGGMNYHAPVTIAAADARRIIRMLEDNADDIAHACKVGDQRWNCSDCADLRKCPSKRTAQKLQQQAERLRALLIAATQ